MGWDKEMCDRLVAGDEAALGELYDQYSSLVYGLAAKVTRDSAAAEDITQDVFVRVWQDPQVFDPERGTWRAWLGTITHRRAVDWVRRSTTHRRYTAVAAQQQPTPPPNPEEAAVAAATAKSVKAAVDDLPTAQREAIMMAYYEAKTYRQVSETLGIPLGTAKSRIWQGLRHLADRLQGEGVMGP
jgi:RNA polymerase sigma factor (sigma-70 family)